MGFLAYYHKVTNDIVVPGDDWDYESDKITAAGVNVTTTVADSTTETNYIALDSGILNNDDWSNGGGVPTSNVFFYEVVTANAKIDIRMRFHRVSNVGANLEDGDWSEWDTMDTVGVGFLTGTTTWAAGNCDDRVRIEIEMLNTDTMMDQSFTLEFSDANSWYAVDWPEDFNCGSGVVGALHQSFVM